MKNIKRYILPIIAGFILISCDDFLDKHPYGKTRVEDLTPEEYAELAGGTLFDAYAHMRNFGYSATPYVGIFSVTSEDADKGSTPTDSPNILELDRFTFGPTNGAINNFYSTTYGGIGKCNKAIQYIDSALVSTDPDIEIQKYMMIAEARFLRGVLYFDLVRCFGGVSLLDTLNIGQTQVPPRSSLDDTYDFIEKDFQYAEQYLPFKSQWPSKWAGRATMGAAKAYLAKVYLYRQRWSEAYSKAKEVIDSREYDLSTPYNKIFTEAMENGPESVFEIQAELIDKYTGLSAEWSNSQGIRGGSQLDLGIGLNVPSETLLAAYESGDPRKNATVIVAGETLEDGTLIPLITGCPKYYNKKAYAWADEKGKRAAGSRPFGGWINVRLMRYADVVLIAAEAATQKGDIDQALTYLEMIRARARGSNSSILPKVTTVNPDELMAKIQHERRIEFAMEQEHYMDLLRWGLAQTTLAPLGWKPNKNELLPIPSAQIISSNFVLTQNPGY